MIITLLTDMGSRDPSLARIHQALTSVQEGVTVTDLCSRISHHNQRDAAAMLLSAWPFFPGGTIHIVAIAPFVGKNPSIVFTEQNGHSFITPDNGTLPLIFPDVTTVSSYVSYSKPYNMHQWIADAAMLAKLIHEKKHAGYREIVPQILPPVTPVQINRNGAECRIVRTDRYGNVTLHITRSEFETLTSGRNFRIDTIGNIPVTKVSMHYADVPAGELLCRFNRDNYLELAVNRGSAAELLQLDTSNPAKLFYQTVYIHI